MKKIFYLLIIFFLPLSALAKSTIKFSHVVSEDTSKGQMALKFKEIVEEKTNGDIKVEVYPNAELLNDNSIIESILLGDVQMAAPPLSKFDKYTSKLQVFDMPFIFKDMDALERFQEGEIGQKLLDSLSDFGIVGLGYLHEGMKILSINSAARVPEDIMGLKFRIQDSDVLFDQFVSINAVPVAKDFPDVLVCLQKKAVDGTESTWSSHYSQGFYKEQTHMVETNHGVIDYMVIISDSYLNSLSELQREVILSAAKESIDFGNEVAREKEKEARDAIIGSGINQVISLDSSERRKWKKSMTRIWDKYRFFIGDDIMDAAIESSRY